MTTLVLEYEIPDPKRPIAEHLRGLCGPSGELIDFRPTPLKPEDVLGRKVCEVSACVGTYGMGGPGFFGLRLDDEWLTISLWGAAEWMHVGGRLVSDLFYQKYQRSRPWISNLGDALSERLINQTLCSFEVQPHALKIGVGELHLCIDEACEGRPLFEGSKEPRRFRNEDDLRRAVFLSPTSELWV